MCPAVLNTPIKTKLSLLANKSADGKTEKNRHQGIKTGGTQRGCQRGPFSLPPPKKNKQTNSECYEWLCTHKTTHPPFGTHPPIHHLARTHPSTIWHAPTQSLLTMGSKYKLPKLRHIYKSRSRIYYYWLI